MDATLGHNHDPDIAKLDDLRTTLLTLKSTIESKDSTINILQSDIHHLETQLDLPQLRRDLAKLKATIETLNRDILNKKETIEFLQKQIQDKDTNYQALQEHSMEQHKYIVKLEEEVKQTKADCEAQIAKWWEAISTKGPDEEDWIDDTTSSEEFDDVDNRRPLFNLTQRMSFYPSQLASGRYEESETSADSEF